MNIHELTNYLDNKGCQLRGCSIREISKIESYFNVKLPVVYKEFLFSMGKDAGNFMVGSSVFYNEIFNLREGSIELLIEDNFKTLYPTIWFYLYNLYTG